MNEIQNLPQTVNEIFLYSTVSTLKPIVGIVVTISPVGLYRKKEEILYIKFKVEKCQHKLK